MQLEEQQAESNTDHQTMWHVTWCRVCAELAVWGDSVCELVYITLANGQQAQESSGSWQHVVSSGHSDTSSGQVMAFIPSSICDTAHAYQLMKKTKQHINGRTANVYTSIPSLINKWSANETDLIVCKKCHLTYIFQKDIYESLKEEV